jgi:hypothetical protein
MAESTAAARGVGVDHKRTAEPLATISLIDCQTADRPGGQQGNRRAAALPTPNCRTNQGDNSPHLPGFATGALIPPVVVGQTLGSGSGMGRTLRGRPRPRFDTTLSAVATFRRRDGAGRDRALASVAAGLILLRRIFRASRIISWAASATTAWRASGMSSKAARKACATALLPFGARVEATLAMIIGFSQEQSICKRSTCDRAGASGDVRAEFSAPPSQGRSARKALTQNGPACGEQINSVPRHVGWLRSEPAPDLREHFAGGPARDICPDRDK